MGSETTSTDATDTSQNWKFPEINLVMKNVDDSTSQEILSHFSSERLMYNIFAEALMSLYNPDMANAPKDVKDITIVFRKMDGIAYTADAGDGLKEIHISLDHFADAGNRIEEELRGILWQETIHVFQHNAKGTCPKGLLDGIAGFVRWKGGFAPPDWKPGPRGHWDDGPEATAYFLDWIENQYSETGFVRNLNLALRDQEWTDHIFFELLKISLEDLWEQYKNEEETDDTPPPQPTELPS